MTTGVVLYHPYIEFHDVGWLKSSLLLWDRVRRIVPQDYVPNDCPEVREALSDGCIANTSPTAYRNAASRRFKELCRPEAIRSLQSLINASVDEGMFGNVGGDVALWRGKLSSTLVSELESKGVLKHQGNWCQIDGFYGGVYMTCLATEMAEQIGCQCVSDRPAFQGCGRLFGEARPSTTSATNWGSLGVAWPAPCDLECVPMEKILNFRHKFADERRAFREETDRIIAAISACENEDEAEDVLRAEATTLRGHIDGHKRRLREIRESAILNLLKIDFRSVGCFAFATRTPDPVAQTFLMIAGFGIKFAEWLRDIKTDCQSISTVPGHYAVRVERRFGDGEELK